MFIDSRLIEPLAAAGRTMADIARELGQPYYRVRKTCMLLGIDVRHDPRGRPRLVCEKKERRERAPRPNPNAERNARMVLMYRQGLSLEKIGQTFNITRERVRQILRRQGVTAQHGGAAKMRRAKDAARKAKQDAHYLVRHGMPYDEYKKWRGTPVIVAYRSQENAARQRGIEWGLNFAEWLDVWLTSGKLEQRGRGKGKYVMSRIKDTGGYVVGNVHVQLATENSLEAVEKWRGKTKGNRGVFCIFPGTERPWIARIGRKQVGRYATEQEAVTARICYAMANGIALHSDGRCDTRKAA